VIAHRLVEQRARGIRIAGGERKRTEIVQHAEVGRRMAKKLQVIAFSRLEQSLLAQQPGALEARPRSVGVSFQQPVELFDAPAGAGERRMLVHLCAWPCRCESVAARRHDNQAGAHEKGICQAITGRGIRATRREP
jgi:hypothetical protein